MIKTQTGSIIKAETDAIVNTVNTVGVMGKGIAFQFKKAFPDNFRNYEAACRTGKVQLGSMLVTLTGQFQPRIIVNFPTKQHWRSSSTLASIRLGLEDLVRVIDRHHITSIAVPPLGCGLGGLRWEDVKPLIVAALEPLEGVTVVLYEPSSAAQEEPLIIRTPKPALTSWRAALLKTVGAYGSLGFEATHLEAQKLLYFLHRAGEPFQASFTKGEYGPYDPGMTHGLQDLDGHYVTGFGDGSRLTPVVLLPGAIEEANAFLAAHDSPETEARIESVTRLIEGFETPYGLELLATVHWLNSQEGAADPAQALRGIAEWNLRKKRIMEARDVEIAWDRLESEGWLAPAPLG